MNRNFMENVIERPAAFEGKNGAKAGTSKNPTTKEAGWMVKLNEKASEDVTLKKGTLWLLGAAVVILNLLFSYGGSFVSWVREDSSRQTQLGVVQKDVGEMRNDMEKLQAQITDMQKAMQEERVARAKAEGFKVGIDAAGGK